jgi:glycosyltransferase involved in cell wall biosynthesis
MISVIMATFNGAVTLPSTLEAFCRLERPRGGIAFVVINNASTDQTASILRRFLSKLPLTILWEPRKGKSNAINRGIAEATGDLLVFTDDDVLPERDWLCRFLDAAETHPEVDLFAGKVRLFYPKKPPGWLQQLEAQGRAYAATPASLSRGPISPDQLKGPNFMIRRKALADERFLPDIGGKSPGDETEFARRLTNKGHRLFFIPEASVMHIVRSHELGLRPVLARYFRIGRGVQRIRIAPTPTGSYRTWLGYPRFVFRQVIGDFFKAAQCLLRNRPAEGVGCLMNASVRIGQAHQWRLERSAKAPE